MAAPVTHHQGLTSQKTLTFTNKAVKTLIHSRYFRGKTTKQYYTTSTDSLNIDVTIIVTMRSSTTWKQWRACGRGKVVIAKEQTHKGAITDLPELFSRAPATQNNGTRHTVTKIIPSTPTKSNELAATNAVIYWVQQWLKCQKVSPHISHYAYVNNKQSKSCEGIWTVAANTDGVDTKCHIDQKQILRHLFDVEINLNLCQCTLLDIRKANMTFCLFPLNKYLTNKLAPWSRVLFRHLGTNPWLNISQDF
jgi:hypothetical protein